MADAQLIRVGSPIPAYYGQSTASFTLNQTTDQIENIFTSIATTIITRLGFRYTLRTGTPPTYRISLQSVDLATGFPTGTILGGGSPASATFTPPASTAWDNTWQWITLDNPVAVTSGDLLAIVIGYASGAIDASNNGSFQNTFWTIISTNFPYTIQNDNGVRSKILTAMPSFGYGSATRAYGFPMRSQYGGTFNLNSNPDEFAIRFFMSPGIATSYQVAGVRAVLTAAAGQDFRVQLYSGTSVIQATIWDGDVSATTAGRPMEINFPPPLVNLSSGVEYRLGFRPSGAANMTAQGIIVQDPADWDAWPNGQNFFLSTRVDDGAWTDVPTTRLASDLILSGLSIPKRLRHRLGGYT